MASKKERERQARCKTGKVAYDLPPKSKETMVDLTAKYHVPQSQIAASLRIYGLKTSVRDKDKSRSETGFFGVIDRDSPNNIDNLSAKIVIE